MTLTFKHSHLDFFVENGLTLTPALEKIRTRAGYRSDFEVNAFTLSGDFLKELVAIMSKNSDEHSGNLQRVSQYQKVLGNPSAKIKRLDSLATAITKVIFDSSEDRCLWDCETHFPYLVTGVVYSPSQKDSPATVSVNLKYIAANELQSKSFTFYQSDLAGGVVAAEAILKSGYLLETPELVSEYASIMKRHVEIDSRVSQQLLFSTANMRKDTFEKTSYRSWEERPKRAVSVGVFKVVNDSSELKKNGIVNNLIVLPDLQRVGTRDQRFRFDDHDDSIDEEIIDDDSDETPALPADNFLIPRHPYTFCFNLETHSSMWIKSLALKPYEYDLKLVDKLILPERHKKLVTLLSSSPDSICADIVSGKSSGTIIMATGGPGLGKTLTAEALSEAQMRILYRVQSDQLGVTAELIESNLKAVFARAERWDAILCIDECDIYVHARGTDIEQNAVVGTLLRTLEYFSGTIFMTTNRDVIIDDAILSRCSAVLRYKAPTKENAFRLYEQYASLFDIKLGEKLINTLIDENPQLSGRTIKNLIRLTARRGMQEPSIEDFKDTTEFIHVDSREAV